MSVDTAARPRTASEPTTTGPDAATLYARAQGFQPRIAELAPAMEKAGRLDDALVADLDAAGLASVLVSKHWGGSGLGFVEAAHVLRLLAQADVSTAWVINNYMLNSLILSRFPMRAQERIFAAKPSHLCAGNLTPSGEATRVPGGFHLNGRWGYASGMWHAEGALFPAMLGGAVHFFLMPMEGLELLDDWDVSAMGASGSITVTARDIFVPEDYALPMANLLTADQHDGVLHAEKVHSYPFTRAAVLTAALAVGALDTAVACARERLASSKPFGTARMDMAPSRIRWADAAQTLRQITLLHHDVLATTEERGNRLHDWAIPEVGQLMLDNVTIYHRAKDALRLLEDSFGSSTYRNGDVIGRMARDIAMICTHLTIADWDVMWEKAARMVLGVPLARHEFY